MFFILFRIDRQRSENQTKNRRKVKKERLLKWNYNIMQENANKHEDSFSFTDLSAIAIKKTLPTLNCDT